MIKNKEKIQQVFTYTSYLLQYPSSEWIEGILEIKEELEELHHPQLIRNLTRFIEYVEGTPLTEIVGTYVYTFDFGKKTNLYVTYLDSGENRERGIELLQLKEHYEQSGWKVTDKELPDYLPLMLEFTGTAELDKGLPILLKYKANIEELRKQLIDNENPYVIVIDCVLMAMDTLE